jgi:RNA polymerase sigma-70 factor (ECF subfamily)
LSKRLQPRPNEEWIRALRGEGGESGDQSILDLGRYLHRLLARTLKGRNLPDEDVADLAQETLTQLVGSLHTFRGDSSFPTWAGAVATRLAFTELRRREAREAKHEAFKQAESDALLKGAFSTPLSEEGHAREHVLAALDHAISTELTERQKIATLAKLRGVSTIEIADQLNSNLNAVYKLVHDARLRLRAGLQRQGVTADAIEELAGGRATG